MDIRKALLVKVELPIYHGILVTTANARYRYPRGRGQNDYKFTIC